MRVLLGKKYAKFSDGSIISIEEFIQNFVKKQSIEAKELQIIVDRSDAFEFSINRLQKSTIFDVYDYLRCRKKILSENEVVFCAQDKSALWNFWEEKEYKLQEVTLLDNNLMKIAKHFDGIVPLEFLIANFCRKIEKIDENTWWIYIAIHDKNEIRIVAGQGSCLLLSRSINFQNDSKQILRELQNSLRFLRRFGLENDVKIITPLEDIELYDQKISPIDLRKICDEWGLPVADDTEDCILKFFYNSLKKHEIFSGKVDLKKYFLKNFMKFMAFALSLLIGALWYLTYLLFNIPILQKEIEFLKNHGMNQTCSSANFDMAIDDENFNFAQNIFKNFLESKNPIIAIDNISEFVDKNKIEVENFSMKNLRNAELKTKLDAKKIKRLKKNTQKVEIKIIENQNANGYEELGGKSSDNKRGANVCLEIG